jgi:multimeric flavodoxin WrbA
MFVLGINGSPREGGNSRVLLEKFTEEAKRAGAQCESIMLNDIDFRPCQECEEMPSDGTCKIGDDFQAIYKKVLKADVLILSAPVFFGSLSAQTKMMIDRFQCLWRARYILGKDLGLKEKKGVFLCVEASDRDDFLQNARSIVRNFFATVNAKYSGEIMCKGIDDKGEILRHPECLDRSGKLANDIISGKDKKG